MKKYLIIFLFLSLFLAGCSKSNPVSLSFDDTVSIFSESMKSVQNSLDLLGFSGNKELELDLEIYGENQDFKMDSKLNASGIVDYTNKNTHLTSKIDSYFWDKSEQQESLVSGNIQITLLDNYSYYLIKEPNIRVGEGNYQGDLLNIISENIKDKRIRIERNANKPIYEIYNNFEGILGVLGSTGTFQQIDTVTYNGKLAHKVVLSTEALNKLNQNGKYKIHIFEGLFVINSSSEVVLKIEYMEVSSASKKYNIKGNIGSENTEIRLQDQENLEQTHKISLNANKKNLEVSISRLINLKELIGLHIKLYPKGTSYEQDIQINGILNISPMLIYGSDLEKNIQIDINGQYLFQDVETAHIFEPDSYVLGQQILGDSFSLQTIMNNNNL